MSRLLLPYRATDLICQERDARQRPESRLSGWQACALPLGCSFLPLRRLRYTRIQRRAILREVSPLTSTRARAYPPRVNWDSTPAGVLAGLTSATK